MLKTLQGFRDFIMRGNVVDLAVGIVIGVAFTGVVTALTESFFTPLIRAIGGGGDLAGTWRVNDQVVDWAAFVNALISFTVTAAVLYFLVVMPMNKLAERRRKGEVPEPAAPSEEVRLLTQIRDALTSEPLPHQRTSTSTPTTTPPSSSI